MEPAFYSRTPDLAIRRRFDIDDPGSAGQALIIERIGEYLKENSHFDSSMVAAVADLIHADKATVQVIYEADSEPNPEPIRVPLEQSPDGQFLDMGSPFDGEVFQDEQGFFGQLPGEPIATNQKIYTAPAPYDEVLHTPEAKTWAEITEMAGYFSMPRAKAEARFGADKLEGYSWKKGKGYSNDDKNQKADADPVGQYLDGWEIYCKESEHIYWVSEGISDKFLDAKPDALKIRGFFPFAPFAIGSKPRKSLFPTPAFSRLSPTIQQLHKQYAQTFDLIRSIRRRALIDGSVPEVKEAFQDLGDQEFISMQNMGELVEKKGLQNLIWYLPVKELVEAIGELTSFEDRFKNLVFEWFGVPEILRGVSDPVETLGAQEIKTDAAHDRFKYRKKQVETLARDTLDIMIDIALKVYPDEKIAQICGFQFMQEVDQANFAQNLAELRSDEERLIRIDIETDSTSFRNERLRAQQVNAVATALVGGLKEVGAMVQQSPKLAAISLRALLKTLSSLPGGKEFEEETKAEFGKMIEEMSQPPPEAPPPPDYEAMKIQIKQQEVAIKQFEAEIKAQTLSAKTQVEQVQVTMEQMKQEFAQMIESQYLQLDSFKAANQAQETVAEESRLAMEAQANLLNPPEQKESQPTTVVSINLPESPPSILPIL